MNRILITGISARVFKPKLQDNLLDTRRPDDVRAHRFHEGIEPKCRADV
jgi:hypothetical protein